MTRQVLNVGIVANDGTGDTFRIAGQKINNNFEELYNETAADTQIEFDGNNIISNLSNADINLLASGTGGVKFNNLVVDKNIDIRDNNITATLSNSDMGLNASGTGSVIMSRVAFKDNTVSTFTSNDDIELTANGSGTVMIAGFSFPTADGSSSSLISTNGSGTLSFSPASLVLDSTEISDGTTTLNSSTTANIDTFDLSTYRLAKYFLSITDSTNSRYEIVEANIIHDGSTAYVSTQGSVSNYGSGLLIFSANVSGGNVELQATPISDDNCVIKFVRILRTI
jgi:hypothetical protein